MVAAGTGNYCTRWNMGGMRCPAAPGSQPSRPVPGYPVREEATPSFLSIVSGLRTSQALSFLPCSTALLVLGIQAIKLSPGIG